MKSLFFTVVIALFFLSCSGPCCKEKSSAGNIALIEKYIDAVQDGDYTTIESMISDNYIGYGPSIDDTINKEDGMASWKYNIENLYEKIEYTKSRNISVTLADGDYPGEWVSNWGVLSIKYKDGRGPVKVLANTLYQIENGLIRRSFTIYNEYDVLEQLGLAQY